MTGPCNFPIKRYRFQLDSIPSLEQRGGKCWALFTIDDLTVQIPVIPHLDEIIVGVMSIDLRDEICLPIEGSWPQDNGANDRRLINFWRFAGSRGASGGEQ